MEHERNVPHDLTGDSERHRGDGLPKACTDHELTSQIPQTFTSTAAREAFIQLTKFPANTARTTSFAKSFGRVGQSVNIAPSMIPIEPTFAKPQQAYVATRTDCGNMSACNKFSSS